MMIISDKELAIFLAGYPLYSRIKFCEIKDYEEELDVYEYFENKAYKFYCPFDKDYHTFKFGKKYGQQYIIKKNYINEFYLDKEGKISFTFHLSSTCQICGLKMNLLLNLFSEDAYLDDTFINLHLRKFGQFPAFERNPENEVLNYLTEEDKDNYRKALSNLSVSYGIGAYAYFRRIIENEIKRLVKDISELEYDNVDKVRIAWKEYETNRQMTNLIETINPFLPKSLKEIGDNPIKILYQQTSGGLHQFSESECLEKAKHVDKLLRYVIKKVATLKHDYIEAREAMKRLTS